MKIMLPEDHVARGPMSEIRDHVAGGHCDCDPDPRLFAMMSSSSSTSPPPSYQETDFKKTSSSSSFLPLTRRITPDSSCAPSRRPDSSCAPKVSILDVLRGAGTVGVTNDQTLIEKLQRKRALRERAEQVGDRKTAEETGSQGARGAGRGERVVGGHEVLNPIW